MHIGGLCTPLPGYGERSLVDMCWKTDRTVAKRDLTLSYLCSNYTERKKKRRDK